MNLTGETFGRLTVVSRADAWRRPSGRYGSPTWNCLCSCGNSVTVVASNLRNGSSTSCGCGVAAQASRRAAVTILGKTFGRLTVTSRAGTQVAPNGCKKPTWNCVCICGGTAVVSGANLRSGNTTSCGCYRQGVHYRYAVVGYSGAHARAVRVKGRPSQHSCIDCGKSAQDWSYDGLDPDELRGGRYYSTYSLDPDHYVPRCKPCHVRTDHTRRLVNG